uniref:Uncharacterized protein n=1 Tax=Glossina morsitans morsitans TaxID=37546 RepID=A0A1B0FE83_GLOMM
MSPTVKMFSSIAAWSDTGVMSLQNSAISVGVLDGSEFHITDEKLMECRNKVKVIMKEVNNIDAPERARGDNKNKTIVDVIFENFSTTPFNSPTASPERNLERSPLFILRKKPKRYYSRKCKENVKSNLEQIFNTAIDDTNDIEKEDTDNINEVSSNQCKTGISENYRRDEDDNDLFFSISTQAILDQNNFLSTSKRGHKLLANKEITQSEQRNNKNLVLRESNVALGLQKASEERPELGEEKNELEAVKNKMRQGVVGKVNNPVTSLVSAGFQTANGKHISTSEEGQKSV